MPSQKKSRTCRVCKAVGYKGPADTRSTCIRQHCERSSEQPTREHAAVQKDMAEGHCCSLLPAAVTRALRWSLLTSTLQLRPIQAFRSFTCSHPAPFIGCSPRSGSYSELE